MEKEEFFTDLNLVFGVTEADYQKAESRLDGLRAMERLSSQKIYVIDYFKKTFLYVSEEFADFCGLPSKEIMNLGFDLYIKHVPDDDLLMLLEINIRQFALLNTFSSDETEEYKFCCDFRFNCDGHLHMVNHQLTPFVMKNGRVWLALCAVSISSSQKPGNIMIKKGNSSFCYDFDLHLNSWHEKRQIKLSKMERDIILLSACGMTVQSISQYLCRSLDAVKSCKRKLFRKLGVGNISEAISYVLNYHLW